MQNNYNNYKNKTNKNNIMNRFKIKIYNLNKIIKIIKQ